MVTGKGGATQGIPSITPRVYSDSTCSTSDSFKVLDLRVGTLGHGGQEREGVTPWKGRGGGRDGVGTY